MIILLIAGVAAYNFSDKNNKDTYGDEQYLNETKTERTFRVSTISAGAGHTLALDKIGSVWAWGSNSYGQIGDGTNTDSNVPKKAEGIDDVKSVFAGQNCSAAVKNDGSVWVWGGVVNGLLNQQSNVPVMVDGLSDTNAVYMNDRYFIAHKNDGTAFMRRVDKEETDGFFQLTADGMGIIENISMGVGYALILCEDKTVWGIGRNSMGQLSGIDGETDMPFKIDGLDDIVDIGAGALYSVALRADGTVYKWGKDFKLISTSDDEKIQFQQDGIPSAVENLSDVISISCGRNFIIALKSDGSVWGFGANEFGVLGDDVNTVKETPGVINDLDDVAEICASGAHAVARKNDQTVWAWGSNHWGQLGNGTNDNKSFPVRVWIDEDE